MSEENKAPARAPASWGRPVAPQRIGRVGDWSGAGSTGPSSSGGSRPTNRGPRIGTLGGLGGSSGGNGGGSGPRPAPDDDDDDDSGETYFAGGERSGLSIEGPRRGDRDPGNLVQDIMRRARPGTRSEEPTTSTAFFGGGNTLGSTADAIPSAAIPDPSAADGPQPTVAHRRIIFWADGFSIDDGDLYRFDDPANQPYLEALRRGLAPQELLNIPADQEADVHVEQRTGENYVAPKRAFGGGGNRLGNPVPGVVTSGSTTSTAMPGSFDAPSDAATSSTTGTAEASRGAISTKFEVDQTQPTTGVTIRLADGTRMVCRMNLTHTVLDLRNFIDAARPENTTRAYTIATTFPTKLLEDNSATIEAAGLANSVVVQKWA